MKPRIRGAIAVMLVVLAAAHAVVFFALAGAFGIRGTTALAILATGLVLLTAGFIAVMIVSRNLNNRATRVLFPSLAAWLGLFLYLFLASIISLAAGGGLIGEIAVGIALLITIAGIIQAATIRITRYDVTLTNLPEVWKGKKVAFISDIHLGQVYGASFARKITDRINSIKPDMLLIGGDLFDGVAVDIASVVAPFANLDIKHGTYFITGNHDQYGNESAYINAIKKVGMRVLDNESVDIDGLQVVGVDYHDTVRCKEYESVLKDISIDRSKPSIFMKHVPSNLDIAEAAGMSLHLSGHTHRAQMFPLSIATHLIYKGFDYGYKRHGVMQAITSSGIGNWGPPIRVGSRSEIVLITLN